MTTRFMPDGEQDATGRLVAIGASLAVGAGAPIVIQVLNQTGKTLTLVGASACMGTFSGADTVDILNAATGLTMLAAPIALGAANLGVAGAPSATPANLIVAAGVGINFAFGGVAGNLDVQATAYFAVAV